MAGEEVTVVNIECDLFLHEDKGVDLPAKGIVDLFNQSKDANCTASLVDLTFCSAVGDTASCMRNTNGAFLQYEVSYSVGISCIVCSLSSGTETFTRLSSAFYTALDACAPHHILWTLSPTPLHNS